MISALKSTSPRQSPSRSLSLNRATNYFSQSNRNAHLNHAILTTLGFVLYFALNLPQVILLSKLGVTAWYPATGLAFAFMLAISPSYGISFALSGAAAGILIYHQPLFSWGTLVGAPVGTLAYVWAARRLRGSLKIDTALAQRRDVLRYVLVSLVAAIFATITGVACLWADHTVPASQLWSAAQAWFFGDATALLSIAPFLLIHVLPRIKEHIQEPLAELFRGSKASLERAFSGVSLPKLLEFAAQGAAIALALFLIFDAHTSKHNFFLCFLPITWIAMRQGIRGSVTGLLVLNFGIVASLRVVPVQTDVFTQLGFLMVGVAATGLTLGVAVSERSRIANELKDHTTFLKSLIEISPFGILVHDCEGVVQLHNDAFSRLFLYAPCEIPGKCLSDLIVPVDQRQEFAKDLSQVNAKQTLHKTVRRLRKDGKSLDLEVRHIPLIRDGQVQGGYAVYEDISEQLKAAALAKTQTEAMNRWVEELEKRTKQLTLLHEMGALLQCAKSTDEAYSIVELSAKTLFAGASSGALFILKASKNSLDATASWGSNFAGEKVFLPNDCWSLRRNQPHWSECPGQGIVCSHVDRAISANHLCLPMASQGDTLGVLQVQCEPDSPDASPEARRNNRESQLNIAVVVASQIALALGNLRLRESLREQSIRDPLTGLYNRRFMKESLERELQRARRKQRSLAMIFLDLDHFKRFNDTFGHEAGDHVLRSVAELFRLHFRADDMICRYGGEEFAIILPESSTHDAVRRAESLRLATQQLQMTHRGIHLDRVTLSIGVAGFPDHAESAEELVEIADKCLYESKSNGRNRVTLAKVDHLVLG